MREDYQTFEVNVAPCWGDVFDPPEPPKEAIRIGVYPGRAITFAVEKVENGVATVVAHVEHDPGRVIRAHLKLLKESER